MKLRRRLRRSLIQSRRRLSRRSVPLWIKGLVTTCVIFLLPFLVLSYISLSENTESEKKSLFQNFYLRAQALSLEMRTDLKDKVDLKSSNTFLVARGAFSTGYEIPVAEALRQNVLGWLSDKNGGAALIEFYHDTNTGRPRILYLEKQRGGVYFIFEADFISKLLDISHNISADDSIFIYNIHEEPFLSNSIEAGYRVTDDWQAGIHKLFWQSRMNGIHEMQLKEDRFIIARYKMTDLPLVIYVARPYAVAMHEVEIKARRLMIIFSFVALIVFLLMMYFFRDQLRTLRYLREFIDGKVAALRSSRLFLVRDERSDIFTDIVHIRELEKKAILQRDDAELRTRAKADFLASMSHEIRNPLNAILGIADLLRERQSDVETRKYLTLIRDSGDSLLQIINDILDISKIESNKLTLENTQFDAGRLISDLRIFFAGRAEAQRDTIEVLLHSSLERPVRGDPTRLRQILINLLSNALKFTEGGTITISARRYGESDAVHIFVHDTGIGISRDSIARIFAAYEQAESSTTRQYGGTGLGLSIALKLARLMQGQIRCRSRLGHGTTFHCKVLLPAVSIEASGANSAKAAEPDLSQLNRLRILVAEDDEINQMLMVENLRNVVSEVVVAENGQIAIESVRAGKFDLVFMDQLMPEMGGLEATAQIRQYEARTGTPRIPIIALSGNAMPEDVADALAAGCDAHLAKPVRKEQIIETLLRYA